MENKKVTRRQFVKQTVGASVSAVLATNLGFAGESRRGYDAKGLPTAILGKTGVEIPRLAFGTGSYFTNNTTTDEALELLEFGLDHGLYYWDTAANYANSDHTEFSEARLGSILKTRRKEVFLATKTHERDGDATKRVIETSLRRLNTDHIDLLQVHSIQSEEDVREMAKPGNVLDVLQDYKRQGITRFIGFTGHTSASAMKMAALDYDFDTMLVALNHHRMGEQNYQEQTVPVAHGRQMGVMGMKVIRPREYVEGVSPDDLFRYALSLPHFSGFVVSMHNMSVLKQNLEILKHFHPLPEAKMQEMEVVMEPFYRHENLAWMQPGYRDGVV